MAVKSEQLTSDSMLKGLLAFQAYNFNKEYAGVAYDPDIFKALYYAKKLFEGDNFNVFSGHSSLIRTIVQYNKTLYSSGSDGKLICWDIQTKEPTVLNSELSIVKKIALHKNLLYGVTDNRFFTYDLDAKSSDLYPITPNEVKDFFLMSNDSLLIIYNQSINITPDYHTKGKEIFKTDSKINTAKYYKQNNSLVVALLNGQILMWNNILTTNSTPTVIANVPQANWGDLALNTQKGILAAGLGNNQGTIYLWDVNSKQQTRVLRGHTAKISYITFSSDGELMASSSYDGSVRLWHMNDLNTLPIVYDDHNNWATIVIFSQDNQWIFTGDKDGNVREYPVTNSNLVDGFCNFLQRDLTPSEWKNYVGEDIPYNPKKCKN